MSQEQIRSFIAIELPDELRQELAQLEVRLKSGGHPSVKWVDPQGNHLTLKFLGNISLGRVGEIIRAMPEATQEISPFHLGVKDLGVFPNLKRVGIVWVGVSGEIDKLNQLQQRLESGLARLGFAPESRPFAAHLTLARVREQASPQERESLGRLIAETKFETNHIIKVAAISLMQSQLTREGAIYHRISSARLGNPLPTASS